MLASYWYIACEAQALRQKPLSLQIFSKPVVLFRNESRLPCALEDRCAHRNAPLSQGRIQQGNIECPYHGWRYRGNDGQVCYIPSLGEAPCPIHLRVPSFPCIEQEGYIWICPNGVPAVEHPPRLPHFGEKGFLTFRMQTRFQGDVESCLENFLDCPHAAYVHNGWFRSHSTKPVRASVRMLPDGAEAEYYDEPRNKGLVWKLISRSRTKLQHTDRFIAPSTTQVDYTFSDGRKYSITSSCTPVTETQTDVFTVVTFHFGLLGSLIKPFFYLLSRKIIKQDVAALREQQKNVERFGGERTYRFIDSDLLLPAVIQWRRAIEENKTPPRLRCEKGHVELRI